MRYLIDTNIWVAVLRKNQKVRMRLRETQAQGHEICVIPVVYYELLRGLEKRRDHRREPPCFGGRLEPFEHRRAKDAGAHASPSTEATDVEAARTSPREIDKLAHFRRVVAPIKVRILPFGHRCAGSLGRYRDWPYRAS